MKDKIILFGCSERILEIEKQIPALIKNHDTIGLNAFPLYYKTKYWLWIDNPDKGRENALFINESRMEQNHKKDHKGPQIVEKEYPVFRFSHCQFPYF